MNEETTPKKRGRKPLPEAVKLARTAQNAWKHVGELVGRKRFKNALTLLERKSGGEAIRNYFGPSAYDDLVGVVKVAAEGGSATIPVPVAWDNEGAGAKPEATI